MDLGGWLLLQSKLTREYQIRTRIEVVYLQVTFKACSFSPRPPQIFFLFGFVFVRNFKPHLRGHCNTNCRDSCFGLFVHQSLLLLVHSTFLLKDL